MLDVIALQDQLHTKQKMSEHDSSTCFILSATLVCVCGGLVTSENKPLCNESSIQWFVICHPSGTFREEIKDLNCCSVLAVRDVLCLVEFACRSMCFHYYFILSWVHALMALTFLMAF